jgi:hypothetical protein
MNDLIYLNKRRRRTTTDYTDFLHEKIKMTSDKLDLSPPSYLTTQPSGASNGSPILTSTFYHNSDQTISNVIEDNGTDDSCVLALCLVNLN